jgi:hypothetical protein
MDSIRRLLILASILVLPITASAKGLDTTKIDRIRTSRGEAEWLSFNSPI